MEGSRGSTTCTYAAAATVDEKLPDAYYAAHSILLRDTVVAELDDDEELVDFNRRIAQVHNILRSILQRRTRRQ